MDDDNDGHKNEKENERTTKEKEFKISMMKDS
jgi:hypothetical protein